MQRAYIKSVRALPDYQLEVVMETGAVVNLDFHTRLRSVRFGALEDEALFGSVRTDGNYLLFSDGNRDRVQIGAKELMDMVLVDRTEGNAGDGMD